MVSASQASTPPATATGQAPTAWEGEPCSVDGLPVCDLSASGRTLTCDLDSVGCTASNAFHAVNFAGSSSVSVFGTCRVKVGAVYENRGFSCFVSDPGAGLEDVVLNGTSGVDEAVTFIFNDAGSVTNLASTGLQHLSAVADAKGGDDAVKGSEVNSGKYDETLKGGKDDDVIHGNGGNDVLMGNQGNDYLYGDEGDDLLHGGWGLDHLYGGANNDGLYGSRGRDYLYGEDGNDYLCETNLPEIVGNTCPLYQFFYGGAGTDRAWMDNVTLGPLGLSCPNMDVFGDRSVGYARDAYWGWQSSPNSLVTDVLQQNGSVSSSTTPWSKCQDLLDLGL